MKPWIAAFLICLVWAAGRAEARLFFVAGDPALQGATVLPLDSSDGFAAGQLQHQVLAAGHQIDFATTHPNGFFGTVFFGAETFVSFFPDGVTIDFSPAVGAVGIQYLGAECTGRVDFEGAAGSESFESQFGGPQVFVGAADIGDISRVTVNGGCFGAAWADLHFVPGGGPPPSDEADLALTKAPAQATASQADGSVTWSLGVSNLGPDAATEARTVDFLPFGTQVVGSSPPHVVLPGTEIAQQGVGDLASGADFPLTLETSIPPFHPDGSSPALFNCESTITNVALTTATSLDPDGANNQSIASVGFDRTTRQGAGEICDNAIDDDCNGRSDCSESSCRFHPHCAPPVIHYGPSEPWDCFSVDCPVPPAPSDPPPCEIDDIHGRPRQMPSHCCGRFGPTRNENGQPPLGCRPGDPNFKVADPPVSAQGYGYAEAGERITYDVTYENVGGIDALDVAVFDPLDEDLDDATLVVEDGGSYDPATRIVRWDDPVVPPATPRTVSFSAEVRSDAPPFTRIRNQATVVFPEATPPRLDTNFTEHVVVEPGMVEVDPAVVGCEETAPGSGEWEVFLFNAGNDFAWNATAEILDPPASVRVSQGLVAFGMPDDPPGGGFRTAIPHNTTPSIGTVRFETDTPDDPCRTLLWRITWDDRALDGTPDGRDVRTDPDGDEDAVADGPDNCPATYNPGQLDFDGDGTGDACEPPPAELDPIAGVRARAKETKVDVVWPPPAGAVSYDVLRSVDGGPFQPLALGHASEFGVYADFQTLGAVEHCYTVAWRDAQGNVSPPSAPACAVPAPRCGLVGAELLLGLLPALRRRARRRASRPGSWRTPRPGPPPPTPAPRRSARWQAPGRADPARGPSRP